MTETSLAQIVLNLLISIDSLLETKLRKSIAKEFLRIFSLQNLLIHSPLAQKRDNRLLHVETSRLLLATLHHHHHIIALDNLRHRGGDLIVVIAHDLLLEAARRTHHLN